MARRTSRILIFIIGNIVFSVLGLAIGYFLLVQVRPDLNFLGLDLPKVADMQAPQVPDWWPAFDWDTSKPYSGTVMDAATAVQSTPPVVPANATSAT